MRVSLHITLSVVLFSDALCSAGNFTAHESNGLPNIFFFVLQYKINIYLCILYVFFKSDARRERACVVRAKCK